MNGYSEDLRKKIVAGVGRGITEHVLLGILENEDGAAVRMLARLGGSTEALEDRLFELRRQVFGDFGGAWVS